MRKYILMLRIKVLTTFLGDLTFFITIYSDSIFVTSSLCGVFYDTTESGKFFATFWLLLNFKVIVKNKKLPYIGESYEKVVI